MSVNAVWAGAQPYAIEAGQEYLLCQFRISAMKTVNSCAGCPAPARSSLSSLPPGLC